MANDLTSPSQDELAAAGSGNPFSGIPDYLVAANNHNVAADSWSLTDYATGAGGAAVGAAIGSVIPGLGTFVGGGIGAIVGSSLALNNGKFVAASIYSGAASFYNTGVEVSNWFGADADKLDITNKLTEYDSDLGAYYQNHKSQVDLAGFFAGSLIPTVGALKAYNYLGGALGIAKSGAIGTNFSSATGLLGNIQARYLATAIEEMGATDTGMRLLNTNMLKAFGTGVVDEFIQGAFASAVTLTTMHASPVLEQMDAKDLAWNVLEGGLFGGAVGGLVRSAGIFGNAAAGVGEFKAATTKYIYGESLPEGSPVSHRILNTQNKVLSSPEVGDDLTEAQRGYATRKKTETLNRLADDIRSDLGSMSGGDRVLSNKMADVISTWDSITPAEEHITGLTKIARAGTLTAEERTVSKIKKKVEGKVPERITDEEADTAAYTQISYLKTHGENAGAVTYEKPNDLSLVDRLKPGKDLDVSSRGVVAPGLGNWKFTTDPKKPFNYLTATNDEIEARNIWLNSTKSGPTITADSVIPITDPGLLKRAYSKGVLPVIKLEDGSSFRVPNKDALLENINTSLRDLRDGYVKANSLTLNKSDLVTNPQIAKNLDVNLGYLEGTAVDIGNPVRDIFAMKTASQDYTDKMRAAGRYFGADNIETFTQPQYVKLVTDTKPFKDVNNFVLEGMALIKEKARLQQISLDNAGSAATGEDLWKQLPDFPAQAMSKAIAEGGPGQGFLTTANKGYGSLGSMFQQIGAATHRIIKQFTDVSSTVLNPGAYALRQNVNVALEWQGNHTYLRSTPEVYYHDHAASELVLRRVKLAEDAEAAGETPKAAVIADPKAPERIPIRNPEVNDLWDAHIGRNGTRTVGRNGIVSAAGFTSSRDPLAAYPLPVNQKQYPHFAFVVDDTVTGTGHISTIYAATPTELDQMITKVQDMPQKYRVFRKDEVERNKEALGMFSKEDTISENAIDSALKRSGVSSNFIPKTDPALIADDLMNWHFSQDRLLARYAVSAKYSKEFDELNRLAEGSTGLQTSRVGSASLSDYMEAKVKNPITDYIKMALDMPSSTEVPLWTAFNNITDNKFTQLSRAVSSIWKDSTSAASAEQVNAVFQTGGVKTAYYDAALNTLANHTAAVGNLQKLVSRSNGILTTLMLRADPMNALNNAFGSLVLTSAETNNIRKLVGVNSSEVGELANIKLPGTSDSIFSPAKQIAAAYKTYFDVGEVGRDWYQKNGFMTRHLMEQQSILEDLAIRPGASSATMEAAADSAYAKFMAMGDVAERVTGNKLAEGMNRFVSAHIMKGWTDLAVEQGLMDEKTALAYINTFVNRTQGVYLASQRPLMFQGAVGQSIGLFQSYQFNMMQQLLRYVSEGQGKTAAMAMGMQSTIYGLHGIPAFDYINNHIIGTASGNPNNRDLYDATYGVAGKIAGDWLMYGAASNLPTLLNSNLGANLYTRGDINPRQLTVVPVNPLNIPIVSASIKFFGALKDTTSKIAGGGDVWGSVLQGIEHAGVNRPLAGLAQTLEALGNPNMQSYGTTTKGDVTTSNDLWSLANMVRLSGAKPLDEAIALDAGFRLDQYKAADTKVREQLGEAMKTKVIAGGELNDADIHDFQAKYVASGGKQQEFNQFMMSAIKNANTSHANKISESLKSPQSQSMQTIMGPYDLRDFSKQYNQ